MKKTLLLVVPAFLAMAGCHGEEPEVPLSPQAQAALKSGNTGIPANAKAGIAAGPAKNNNAGRAAEPNAAHK